MGSDSDTSFSAESDSVKKLAGIKKELDRAAGDINLGIGWDCRNALPIETADKNNSLRFLALSSQQPLSQQELGAYLDAGNDSHQKRWVSLQPLSKSSHSIADRAEDLVKQIITAKIHGADAIFCLDPFDADCGLMNKDGTPGELFLPWRTTALALGGAKFLGSLLLPHGSQNLVFTRANDAVMIVWNNKPGEELLYLGEDAKQVDIWGRARTPEKRENAQVIHVDSMPAFVIGLNKPIAHWQMDLSIAEEHMPSITGRPQANAFRVKNPFPCEAAGTATVVAPRGWIVEPERMVFSSCRGRGTESAHFHCFPGHRYKRLAHEYT